MSMFSSVDASDDPTRAADYLDQTALAESGMKHYALATHALRKPNGFVLDVGCGTGHDLALLASAGMSPVGIEPSAVLLGVARSRYLGAHPLLRAVGEALPFRDASIAGARIERVLMHVLDPSVVVGELVRCLRTGALVTVFEPDWSQLTVRTETGDQRCGWISGVRHLDVGGALWGLLEASGCAVLDRVEELSVWPTLATLDRVTDLTSAVEQAAVQGRISRDRAAAWTAEQRERDRRGVFRATMPKIMIVARKV